MATSPTATTIDRSTVDGAAVELVGIEAMVESWCRRLDPALLLGTQAAGQAERLAVVIHRLEAAQLRLAHRAEECAAHRGSDRSAPGWLARLNGSTVAEARRALELAGRLEQCPAAAQALIDGELSVEKTAAVTEAAVLDPGAERRLVDKAKRSDLFETRAAADKIKQASRSVEDDALRQARMRRTRSWKVGPGPEGHTEVRAWFVPAEFAQVKPVLDGFMKARVADAQARGERDGYDAYAADAALAALHAAGRTLGLTTRPTATNPTDPTGTGAGCPEPSGPTDSTAATPTGSTPTNAGPTDLTGTGSTGATDSTAATPTGSTPTNAGPTDLTGTGSTGATDSTGAGATAGGSTDSTDSTGAGATEPADSTGAGATDSTASTASTSATASGADPPGATGATGATGAAAVPLFDTAAGFDTFEGLDPEVDWSVVILVDGIALKRGYAAPGETCEIPGVGTIPVSWIHQLLPTAQAEMLIHDSVDIRAYATTTRHRTRPVDLGVRVRDRDCIAGRCHHPISEIDHRVPYAETHETSMTNLGGFCHHDHDNKSYRGGVLERGDTDWHWWPPGTDPTVDPPQTKPIGRHLTTWNLDHLPGADPPRPPDAPNRPDARDQPEDQGTLDLG